MDVQSVAHTLGTCFAEFVRESIEDHGGHGDEGKLLAETSRRFGVPAEYGERMMGYAVKNGAVEVKEFPDGGATVSNICGYAESSLANSSADALAAEDRGDYPVAYGLDTRRSTPAVLFPESTKDYASGGPAETTATEDLELSGEMFYRQSLKGRILETLGSEVSSHGQIMRRVFPMLDEDLKEGETIADKRGRAIKSRYSVAMNALCAEGRVQLVEGAGAYRLRDSADSLRGSAAIDRDEVGAWRKDYRKRAAINARIVAESPAPQRVDYGADIVSAEAREKIEAESRANTFYSTREDRQQHGCIHCQQANARGEFSEEDRIINWLYGKLYRAQEIKAMYYERGAHTPAQQQKLANTLSQLEEEGKVRTVRRGGRWMVQLSRSVEPRAYTVEDYANNTSGGEDSSEEQDQPVEQSFEPAVMAEMTAAGASYSEVWDS